MKTPIFSSFFKVILCSVACVGFSVLSAAEVTRAEYQALLQRVEALEETLRMTRNLQTESLAAEVVASMPKNASVSDRNSLIDDVVERIQAKEESAFSPWMDLAKWQSLKKGMSPEAVVAILGEPRLNEPSMHKRVDTVYTYQGRRVATGKKVEGIVRFYKDKVIEIEVPEL